MEAIGKWSDPGNMTVVLCCRGDASIHLREGKRNPGSLSGTAFQV